jgi:hypothetical protein
MTDREQDDVDAFDDAIAEEGPNISWEKVAELLRNGTVEELAEYLGRDNKARAARAAKRARQTPPKPRDR